MRTIEIIPNDNNSSVTLKIFGKKIKISEAEAETFIDEIEDEILNNKKFINKINKISENTDNFIELKFCNDCINK